MRGPITLSAPVKFAQETGDFRMVNSPILTRTDGRVVAMYTAENAIVRRLMATSLSATLPPETPRMIWFQYPNRNITGTLFHVGSRDGELLVAYAVGSGKKEIASYTFNVEEFVPERMKVEAKTVKAEVLITEEVPVEIAAKYLFGGSASGSRVEMSCELKPSEFAPKTNANFEYGIWHTEEKAPQALAIGTSSGQIGAGKSRCRRRMPFITSWESATLAAPISVFN